MRQRRIAHYQRGEERRVIDDDGPASGEPTQHEHAVVSSGRDVDEVLGFAADAHDYRACPVAVAAAAAASVPPPPRCFNILFAVGSCVPTIAQDRRGSGSCLNRSSSIASRSTTDSPAPRRSSHATLGRASEEEEEDAEDARREEKNRRRGGLGGAASAAVAVATISSGRDDNIVDLLLLLLSRPPPAAAGLVVGDDPPIEWEEIVVVRTATMRGAHRNSSTVVGSDAILIMLPRWSAPSYTYDTVERYDVRFCTAIR